MLQQRGIAGIRAWGAWGRHAHSAGGWQRETQRSMRKIENVMALVVFELGMGWK
jgi:hypothetical protein